MAILEVHLPQKTWLSAKLELDRTLRGVERWLGVACKFFLTVLVSNHVSFFLLSHRLFAIQIASLYVPVPGYFPWPFPRPGVLFFQNLHGKLSHLPKEGERLSNILSNETPYEYCV